MSKIVLLFFFFIFSHDFAFSKDDHSLRTPTGGDFSIASTLGKNFNLSDLRGKTIFLFFGFTKCPQVCPMTVQRLKMLSEHLEKKKIKDVHFLFISVDNERDSIESLSAYAKKNGPLFSAATASDEELRKIIALYGGHFSKIRTRSNQLIVDHSSNVYVIAPDGKWVNTIEYDRPFSDYLFAYEKSSKKISSLPPRGQRREMNFLGKNENCDLGEKKCTFGGLEVTFSPYPIKTEKEFQMLVKNSSKLTPVEFDFVGVEQNMGLIRPTLALDNGLYRGKIRLPLCETSTMRWKVRLILKDQFSKLHYIEYSLQTKE